MPGTWRFPSSAGTLTGCDFLVGRTAKRLRRSTASLSTGESAMSFRVAPLISIALAVIGNGISYGQQPRMPIRLADVSVASAQPIELGASKEWSKIPEFLRGAKIYFG